MTSLCFIQQRNFVSHSVNRECVRHKCCKEAHTKHYVLQPFNQQSNDTLCTLITWLFSPVAGCHFALSAFVHSDALKPEINSDKHTLNNLQR